MARHLSILMLALSMATGGVAQTLTTPPTADRELLAEGRTYTVRRTADSGFVVAAKDAFGGKVLARLSVPYHADSLPDGLRWWFSAVDEALERMAVADYVAGTPAVGSASRRVAPVDDFLQTQWGQGAPYNGKCPLVSGVHAKTGCMATAMAQVMRYYHWPKQGTGQGGYYVPNGNVAQYQAEAVNSVYDWDAMDRVNFRGAPANADDAVATLMYDCGKAVKTIYNVSASAAPEDNLMTAMVANFGYDGSSIRFCQRAQYPAAQWLQTVQSELQARRPIFYNGYLPNGVSGHAFLLSGLDSEGRVYVNWGEDGRYDNFFSIDELILAGNDLRHAQTMVVGVRPAGGQSAIQPTVGGTAADYYLLDGSRSSRPRRGVNIVRQGGRVCKMVR